MVRNAIPHDWVLYKIVVETRCFAAARAKCQEMMETKSVQIQEGTDHSLRTSGTLRQLSEESNKIRRDIHHALWRSLTSIDAGSFHPPQVRYWHVDENDQVIEGSLVVLPWQDWVKLYPPCTGEFSGIQATS